MAIVSTSSNTIKLKIQVLYYGNELPRSFEKSRMKRAKNGELWLSETSSLINIENIIEPVAVWLQDSPCSSNCYQFYIKEILYNYEGRWRIRNIKLRHHHPSDYIQTSLPTPQKYLY